ncbi:hypothetical protein BC835DRAFT_132509 [Cytidiella melzeri]|nr:hypothetical protein BC835DRAFT_132509 [Cytidiella melzeri]
MHIALHLGQMSPIVGTRHARVSSRSPLLLPPSSFSLPPPSPSLLLLMMADGWWTFEMLKQKRPTPGTNLTTAQGNAHCAAPRSDEPHRRHPPHPSVLPRSLPSAHPRKNERPSAKERNRLYDCPDYRPR